MLHLDLPKDILPNTPFLLAVSGGVDSMVLAHAMHALGHQIVIAHANFQLRGAESEADMAFVKQWAQAKNIKVFTSRFATTQFAAAQGISIQMAARDLRYQWFSNLCELYGFPWIVTGHHLDDQWEFHISNSSGYAL
jgi:tRNA(Ile)-lysidine synthase